MPAYGIDNSLNTRWSSGAAQYSGMWFLIDMQSPQIFFGITLDTQDQPQDSPALFDVYLSMDGTFTTPIVTHVAGSALTVVAFPSKKAVIARYIKLVLAQAKSTAWWGMREITVND
jgi:hypothetical protein